MYACTFWVLLHTPLTSSLSLMQHVMLCLPLWLAFCFQIFLLVLMFYSTNLIICVFFCCCRPHNSCWRKERCNKFNKIYNMLKVCWLTTNFFQEWKRISSYTLYKVDINYNSYSYSISHILVYSVKHSLVSITFVFSYSW